MQLTRFRAGSVGELWSISFPLMMSSLSMVLMIFIDRLFLAHYNLAAMSAAVTAGTASWGALGSLSILAGMAEVLVAQYHGAKRYDRVAEPVWQMLWFSLFSLVIFLPLAFWAGSLFFAGSPLKVFEEEYFFWLMVCGPIFVAQAAISAYFIGRGKPGIVTWMAVAGNLLNVVLDWWFIFGVEGWIPAMGLKGAAWATSLGSLLQVIVLFALFLRPKHREQYRTANYRLVWSTMRTCMRVGAALAGMFFIEIVGWTFFYRMISHVGPEQIFVAGIAQSMIILFMFISEGVGRGASTIVGNYIGSNRHKEAYRVFRAGLKLHLLFFMLLSVAFVIFPDFFVGLFMADDSLQRAMGSVEVTSLQYTEIEGLLTHVLQLCLFFLLFEGLRFLVSGMLTAAGDTRFILGAGATSVTLFLLLPTYLFIYKMQGNVAVAFSIGVAFSFLIGTVFLWRFYRGNWQKIDLIGKENPTPEESPSPGS